MLGHVWPLELPVVAEAVEEVVVLDWANDENPTASTAATANIATMKTIRRFRLFGWRKPDPEVVVEFIDTSLFHLCWREKFRLRFYYRISEMLPKSLQNDICMTP